MSKREKPKIAVDTKTEKPVILSAKTERPISKSDQNRETQKPNALPLVNSNLSVS